MLEAITAIAGLLTTILAWYFSPGRQKADELNRIFKELDDLYTQRDQALEKNRYDILTSVIARINVLRNRKNALL